MRTRQPFEDVPLEFELVGSMGDGSEHSGGCDCDPFGDSFMCTSDCPGCEGCRASRERITGIPRTVHPDAVEKGIELPLGFMPHKGENRRTRRKEVANWQPPKTRTMVVSPETAAAFPVGSTMPVERMPTRRELLKQRQRQRRGKLDIETRRLQRARIR